MRIDRDGYMTDAITKIGEVFYKDVNGGKSVYVNTDGEFWRVVCAGGDTEEMLPSVARKVARLLLKAADRADAETKRMKKARS